MAATRCGCARSESHRTCCRQPRPWRLGPHSGDPSKLASHRLDRRKPLVVLGYALSTATRPWLAAITSWPPALVIRFGDRVAKGIRTSPRDALLADSAPPAATGRVFGLNRAMDSLGSFGSLAFAFNTLMSSVAAREAQGEDSVW